MRKGKFSKIMSVALSASLLLGSLPLWGGGKAEAAVGNGLFYENPQGVVSVEYGTAYIEPDGNLVHYGSILPTIRDGTRFRPNSLDDQIPGKVSMFSFSNNNKFAMTDEGTIWAWGGNMSGSLGIGGGSTSVINHPVELTALSSVESIANYEYTTGAIKDGILYGWGKASYGQFGTSSSDVITTPKKITLPDKAKKVGFTSTASLVLLENGKLLFSGGVGNLWKGKGFEKSSIYAEVPLNNVENFWLNGGMAVAVTSDGKFWGWGDTYLYNGGITEITDVPSDIKTVSVGYNHIVLLTENGDVYTAGRNSASQLGFDSSVTPLLTSFKKSNRFPANVDYVYAGYNNTFVRTTDGKLYGVGYNENSNFGLSHSNVVGYPTVLPALENKVSVVGDNTSKNPTTPTNFKVTTEETSLTASWDSVDGATGYKVTVGGQEVYSGSSLSYTYTGLTANTDYTIDVVAVNSAGESTKASLTVKTKATPAVADTVSVNGEVTGHIDSLAGLTDITWTYATPGALYMTYHSDSYMQYTINDGVYFNIPKLNEGILRTDTLKDIRVGQVNKIKIFDSATKALLGTFEYTPPSKNTLKLGNLDVSYGDIVDLKSEGKWVVADSNLLISPESKNYLLDNPKHKVDVSTTYQNTVSYELAQKAAKVYNKSLDTPFVTKSWDVKYYTENEYAYTYESPVGVVDTATFGKYRGLIMRDQKYDSASALIAYLVFPDYFSKDNLSAPYLLGSVVMSNPDPILKNRWDITTRPAGSMPSYRFIAQVQADTKFTGLGSALVPYTVTALGAPEEVKLEAPGQPTVVSTEVGNVKISWPSSNGALIYKVQRNGVDVGSVATTEYTDKNAVEGETYIYTVKAFDGSKTSDASTFVLVNVTAKTDVPKPPSSPMNFRVVSDEHSITVSWDASKDATEYKVVVNGMEVYKGSDLSYTYSNLPEKTEYRVELSALNAHGESGVQLFTIKTKDPVKLPAAKNPKAETTHNEAVISWDAVEGATGYWVRINNDFVYEGADTTFTAKGLGSDRPYTVYIFAKNDKVEGEPATLFIVTKKDPVVLDKPTNLVAVPKETSIKLTWNAVAGATEYTVKQEQSIVYQGPLTAFTDTELTSGVTYNYTVNASNGTVKSEESTVSSTTLVGQLPYPANLRITTLKYNNVRIDWDSVDGADEYQVTRDGMPVGIPMSTWWSDDANSISPGATYTYKVAAIKNGVVGKEAVKVVNVPSEPIQGVAPTGDLTLKSTRVAYDKVGLQWNTVTGATYYELYQDNDVKVWTGTLNGVTDDNVGPEESHTYKVVAANEWGTLDSNEISITTPSAPQSIVITPTAPMEGTITFEFRTVEGAVHYVERNPQTIYEPLGNNVYKVTYRNDATGEVRDEGTVTAVDGKLPFSESGIEKGKDYHYDILAVIKKVDGSEEVVGESKVDVTAPADGSGVTVPGTTLPPTDPGTGGGNTPTPNPGTDNGGGTTPANPPTPGTGGSVTNPSTGGSTPSGTNGGSEGNGTVAVPGTVGGTDTEVITEEETEPTTPPSFSDVDGSFAKEAILSLSAKGIVKGYADGTFGGKKKVTRAEFAIFINRALGYTSFSSYLGTFVDFNQEAWYATELNSALQNGITKGFNDNTYRPNAFIPREQAAIMLSNVLLNNGAVLSSTAQYEDYDSIVSWATESVDLVTQESIMGGYPGNKFLPKRELTREEAAQLIYNLINS